MRIIDGSIGEGGGQVLRTALTLSMMTSQDLMINNIRYSRDRPGLRPQHLSAVKASAKICQGATEGVEIGSTTIKFNPGRITPGNYIFDVGTAGSVSLVFQTIFLPLCFAGKISKISIIGGTHVPWSPSYHYLSGNWLLFMEKLGFNINLSMVQAGYYPIGGGNLTGEIHPITKSLGLNHIERGKLKRVRGVSGYSNLPRNIGVRQRNQVIKRLGHKYPLTDIRIANIPSRNKGTFLVLIAEFEKSQGCFCGLGALGKPSENVADEAIDSLEEFFSTEGVVDPYLADQLLLPLAFAESDSTYVTSKVTQHLITNAAVIKEFLPIKIDILGEKGKPGKVSVKI